MTNSPSIILVRPQMGENIGAAARVMANFGLGDLRLVAPRDGWPNPKAADMAAKALPIVDDARVFETTPNAVEDCQFVLATSARSRAMSTPCMDAREAMQEIALRAARGEQCAVLFGPERTGLENEDIAVADALISIPVSAEYSSLNLAQAVAVVAYEWRMSAVIPPPLGGRLGGGQNMAEPPLNNGPLPTSPLRVEELPAPRTELFGLFGQLETALDDINFWRVPEKKEGMWLNIRAMLLRAGMSSAEVATWRGIIKGLRG